MIVKYAYVLTFCSDPFITPRKKKRYYFFKYFFKTMVGTFCANCTVTGYPCYLIRLFTFNKVDIVIRQQNFADRRCTVEFSQCLGGVEIVSDVIKSVGQASPFHLTLSR